jgi:ribosomal protein S18 acetylase RimI-like enzyme
MAVTKNYRNNGIGTQMFESAVQWMKKKDVKRIELRVASTNELSRAFWKKQGFEVFLLRMRKPC